MEMKVDIHIGPGCAFHFYFINHNSLIRKFINCVVDKQVIFRLIPIFT